jgi:hypothetical protein
VGARVAYLIVRTYFRIKRKTLIRYQRLLNKLAHDMALIVLYVKGDEDKFCETLSAKLFSISYWKQESDDARLNLFKRNKEKKGYEVYNRVEDFFEAIENRDNSIRNKPPIQEVFSEDNKELNLKVTDEIRHLNIHLVNLVSDFFKKHSREIERSDESVKIYTIYIQKSNFEKKKYETMSLGKNVKIKKDYNNVFFNQYKCHLVIEILRNIRWKGWVMLFLIFSGSYIIFWLLVTQPDIWSHISKLL